MNKSLKDLILAANQVIAEVCEDGEILKAPSAEALAALVLATTEMEAAAEKEADRGE